MNIRNGERSLVIGLLNMEINKRFWVEVPD